MHHRGCTRTRAINLHFIIFYDAFNNDAVHPPPIPGGREKRAKERFHRPCTLRRWSLPCNFILINPLPPLSFADDNLEWAAIRSGGLKRTRIPGRFFRPVRLFLTFDEYHASIAFRFTPYFGKSSNRTYTILIMSHKGTSFNLWWI